MPTNRTRTARSLSVPKRTLMLLGMGAGMHSVPDRNLRRLWERHGEAVSRIWLERYGKLPFVAQIAEAEGWDDDQD
jgi:hypothetical protein